MVIVMVRVAVTVMVTVTVTEMITATVMFTVMVTVRICLMVKSQIRPNPWQPATVTVCLTISAEIVSLVQCGLGLQKQEQPSGLI